MYKYYVDAGTSRSKIAEISEENDFGKSTLEEKYLIQTENNTRYFIVPSKDLKTLDVKFDAACGHMSKNLIKEQGRYENEIIALAYGAQKTIKDLNKAVILDIGSRDTKWIRFFNGKYKDLDWNTNCGSATGATLEMLMAFYGLDESGLEVQNEKFPVTCGVFGIEKIMDEVASGELASKAVSKYIHGIAYNSWIFCNQPNEIYLSGGMCLNKCFVESLEKYAKVNIIGCFAILEGLIQ